MRRYRCAYGNDEPYGEVSLFPLSPLFDGPDLEPDDQRRLASQQLRIVAFMADHQWHTLKEIAAGTRSPEASASAQLRHLRKPKFGGYTIERRHQGHGLYQYRLPSTQREKAS